MNEVTTTVIVAVCMVLLIVSLVGQFILRRVEFTRADTKAIQIKEKYKYRGF